MRDALCGPPAEIKMGVKGDQRGKVVEAVLGRG